MVGGEEILLDTKKVFSRMRKKWRERQNLFTLGDLDFRDKLLLWSFSQKVYRWGFSANRITLLGAIVLALWVLCYDLFQIRSFGIQILFLSFIGFTDFVDGPVARNNDDETVEGTLGDYFRDLCLILYAGRVALDFGLGWDLFLAIVAVEILFLCIKCWAFLWYMKSLYSRERLAAFAFDNFQCAIEDRFQFGLLCFGLASIIFGEGIWNDFFINSGNILIWLSLGLSIAVLIKELRWSPEQK